MATNKSRTNSGSSHETLKSVAKLPNELGKEATENIKKGWSDMWKQLLGGSSSESSKQNHAKPPEYRKDPKTGEVVFSRANHKDTAKSSERKGEKRAAIDYYGEVVKSRERTSNRETQEMDQRVNKIMEELKRLVSSSRVLQLEFAEVTVEQGPVKAGEYHLNFLEWMLIVIKTAREKVEDSGAWLAAVKGKGGKKGFAITDMSQHQAGEKTTIQNSAG